MPYLAGVVGFVMSGSWRVVVVVVGMRMMVMVLGDVGLCLVVLSGSGARLRRGRGFRGMDCRLFSYSFV